jgi:hypothetical protein
MAPEVWAIGPGWRPTCVGRSLPPGGRAADSLGRLMSGAVGDGYGAIWLTSRRGERLRTQPLLVRR